MYKLQLFDAADPTQLIDARLLTEGAMTIGRDPRANWPIDDPDCALSRWHCELIVRPEGLILRATGANGVFFDESGERVPQDVDTLLLLPCHLSFGSFRLIASSLAGEDHEINADRTMLLTPPVGLSAEVPTDWSDTAPIIASGSGSLLEAFCHGAGLDSSLLSAEEPEEIMERAGAIFRQMVLGMGDLMSERDRARSEYDMTRTTIGGRGNNPFKWAPTQRLALDLLLSGPSSFLSGPQAVQSSFRDIKRHLLASFAGLQGSLRTAVRSFSPDELSRAGTDKRSFLQNRAAAQLEEVERRYQDLAAQLEEGRTGSLDKAFTAAYDEADSAARQVQS